MAKKKAATKGKTNGNGANLGFEQTLWLAADKFSNHLDAAEYKHVVLGLIFLKYISDAFAEVYAKLADEKGEGAAAEDPDEYRAVGVFWVPPEARWDFLQAKAKQPNIGKLVDGAMDAIKRDNAGLKGVLPKQYARPVLDKQRLGELIDLIGTIGPGDCENRSKDILGRVYEYFLSQFASAEGKKGGQFYTPRCIVHVLVEMLAPYKDRVFDPCCGRLLMLFISCVVSILECSMRGQRCRHSTATMSPTCRSLSRRRQLLMPSMHWPCHSRNCKRLTKTNLKPSPHSATRYCRSCFPAKSA